jgi:hypothetical protein
MSAGQRDPRAGFEQLLDYRRHLLERLEQQPAEFALRVAAIPAAAWHEPRTEQEREALRLAGYIRDAQGRSLLRVAAHVRNAEANVYLPRIRRIVSEDRPQLTIEASHDEAWASFDPDESMTAVLAAWSQARAELVQLLRPLSPAGWTRMGFYPPTGNRTVQWWAEKAYAHAEGHVKVI